jgi:outer membrane receptor protein involved in Fe transport
MLALKLLGTLRHEPYTLTATYTYVRARERVDGVRQDVALTPRRAAGIVGMWEREDKGRVGVEFYYTGAQRLEESPIR